MVASMVQVGSGHPIGLMLEMLVAAHDAGRLQFFGDHAHLADKAAFRAYLAPLHRTKWFVYCKRQGTLPIILTVPHGGREAIPGVAPRNTRGRPSGGRGYVTVTDTNTDRLAEGIAAEIKALTGKDVYLVTAKFERKFADPNRPPEIGLDSPAARPYYDYYHQSVRRFIDEIRRKYPAGLLIDVHGQKKDPTVLMRGTRNGHSVERLLERAGVAAVTGPNGMFGQLEAHGFKIYPANDVPPGGTSENGGYSGGYTVGTYGSHDPNGIDAVQMEFGSRYRQNATVDKAAREAGKAIAAFYASYLKTAPN
jgi:N-formylglutamate amidohydrolase